MPIDFGLPRQERPDSISHRVRLSHRDDTAQLQESRSFELIALIRTQHAEHLARFFGLTSVNRRRPATSAMSMSSR
jgi:hypothetical protein